MQTLLLIDYTESCCLERYERPQWGCTLAAVRALQPKLKRLVHAVREEGRKIVWIRPCPWIPGKIHPNLQRLYSACPETEFYTDGTGAEAFYGIAPQQGEPVFEKNLYSAFTGTGGKLHEWLQSQDVSSLAVAGIYSTGCVNATICEAFHLGYELTILRDCVETFDRPVSQEFQQHLLREWSYAYGKVVSSDEWLPPGRRENKC